ncbi:MAG: hypothetical protein JXR79_01605 [Nitrospirae bacterium]|nr:hypothetical protein [Nitrospirota bacterium]
MHRDFAVIDIGTNTIRLIIASVKDGRLVRRVSRRVAARLGAKINDTGKLDTEGMNKALDALQSFSQTINLYNVVSIKAVGTYALRVAANSKQFIKEAADKTGISIDVISGEQEADLTLKGITAGCPSLTPPYVLIDIGGGSTELISVSENTRQRSIPVGAVKLHDKLFSGQHQIDISIKESRVYLSELFKKIVPNISDGLLHVAATGGTATTLAAIDMQLEYYDPEKVHGHLISLRKIDKIIENLSSIPMEKRPDVKGLEKDRADIIIPGALILSSIVSMLPASSVVISDYGLLEALIFDASE